MSGMRASLVLELIDRMSRPLARASKAVNKFDSQTGKAAFRAGQKVGSMFQKSGIEGIAGAASNAGKKIGTAADQAGRLAGKLALLGGAGGFLFKTQLLDTAAAFERYETILETIEGSSQKARLSMSWVNDFAAETPFQLDEVVASFVKLRTRGLDPTSGLLRTLGDTAAAMGVSVDQAVEAVADAMTGEFERLKELGITQRTQGNKTMFEYVKNGETVRKVVDRRNKQMIVSTLQSIWNDQYGGAMNKLSSKWDGMISNISDQWTRFANMIMASGVFEWMKDRLAAVLERINKLASSGQLEEMAKQIGGNLLEALKQFWAALQALVEIGQAVGGMLVQMHDLFGSWEPVLIALGAFIAGPFLVALGSAIIAIGGFGTALMATPIGWFIAAVAGIVGAAGLIYENWGPIAGWFDGIWQQIKIGGQELKVFFLDLVATIASKIGTLVSAVPKSLRSTLGIDGLSASISQLENLRKSAQLDLSKMRGGGLQAADSQSGRAAIPSMNKQDVGGEITIKIESDQRAKVTDLKSTNKNVGLTVNTGLIMDGG